MAYARKHRAHGSGRCCGARPAALAGGQPRDLDRYDAEYTHIVLWDVKAQAVAGGYRVRCFFPSKAYASAKKLYTASLFRFHREFFEECGMSLELGRAFVASAYQRDYAPLLLLWKGIARLAVMAGVRTLFGPSSIGLGYTPESIFMLGQHLMEHHWDPALAALQKCTFSKEVDNHFQLMNTPKKVKRN